MAMSSPEHVRVRASVPASSSRAWAQAAQRGAARSIRGIQAFPLRIGTTVDAPDTDIASRMPFTFRD